MPGERRLRILAALVGDTGGDSEATHLCRVSAHITRMSGAGVMLMSGELAQGSVCTSNPVSALVERLQFELGEGPCVDAYHLDRPVLEADLVTPSSPRWIAFSGRAIDAGVRAVFGFPIRVGAVRLGALNLYRDRSGSLTSDQHADALVMADVVAEAVLVMQTGASPGRLAGALEVSADFPYVVHQAAGMVAVQLRVTVVHALIRLRAHAFGSGRVLSDVARDVVDRTLRFGES